MFTHMQQDWQLYFFVAVTKSSSSAMMLDGQNDRAMTASAERHIGKHRRGEYLQNIPSGRLFFSSELFILFLSKLCELTN